MFVKALIVLCALQSVLAHPMAGIKLLVDQSRALLGTIGASQVETENVIPHWDQAIDKRQDYLARGLRASLGYRCPHSGPKSRTFRWEFRYIASADDLTFVPLENIRAHNHITRITNDFGTTWYDRWCEMHGDMCCMYSAQAQTIGSIYDESLDVLLVTSRISRPHKPKIMEICMEVSGEHGCQNYCPAVQLQFAECQLVAIMTSGF